MRLAPAPAARRMLNQPTEQRVAAVPHDATIVFFDLIGSSTIAEKIPPADFNTLLNVYFDRAVENVEKHQGQIAAFSGDGITAVFTGIHHRENHAVHACLAATAIFAAMRKVNADNAERGLPSLHMRVGMNSGEVAEGEIGSRDRFNFSVVGDTVNLAARLEQMGKTLFPRRERRGARRGGDASQGGGLRTCLCRLRPLRDPRARAEGKGVQARDRMNARLPQSARRFTDGVEGDG